MSNKGELALQMVMQLVRVMKTSMYNVTACLQMLLSEQILLYNIILQVFLKTYTAMQACDNTKLYVARAF